MLQFRAPVTKEGSKASSIRVTVPKKTVVALPLRAPCWVRIRVDGSAPLFAWARRPPSRNSVDVGLTQRHFPIALAGTEVTVDIEPAEPYRAVLWTDRRGFDWLPFVPSEHYFPTETVDGKLSLHNRYEEPFVLRRVTPLLETYRMLGVYQAEGSKSADAPDFSLSNSNSALLAHVVKLLDTWGLDRSRLSMEVLREPDADPACARAAYESIGVEIVAERVRTGPGGKSATLHVRKSQPLLRLVKGALAKVFAEKFPSQDAAREYALGWLDGDGSITRGANSDDLRLAGLAEEHAVVKRALQQAFGWVHERGSYHRDTRQGTHITLRAHEMLDLVDANAFPHSMNRVRLLLAFAERTARLAAFALTGEGLVGALTRWGLVSAGTVTQHGRRVLEGRERHQHALERAQLIARTRPELFKVKGAALPETFEAKENGETS